MRTQSFAIQHNDPDQGSQHGANAFLPWLVLVAYSLFAIRLERRPLLHPGHALAMSGLVLATAFILGHRLSRTGKVLWAGLALFLLGGEVHEAWAYHQAAQTFLICRVTPDGSAVIQRSGTAHLRDVTMRVIDYTDLHAIHERRGDDLSDFQPVVQTIQLGNFISETEKSSAMKPLQPHGDRIRYHLAFASDNGFWWESLELRKLNGRWVEALRVWRFRDSEPKVLYEAVDPALKAEGEIDWKWATDVM